MGMREQHYLNYEVALKRIILPYLALTMGSSTKLAITATTVILLASVVFVYKLSRVNSALPPGPSKVPLFGNLFQLRTLRPYPQVSDNSMQVA